MLDEPSPSDESAAELPSLEFIFEQVDKQFDIQASLWDSADRKLQLVLGITGVVFAVVFGLERPSQSMPAPVGIMASLGLVLFLAASGIAVRAYWPREIDRPPKPDTLRNEYLATAEAQTRLEVLDTMVVVYEVNEAELKRKLDGFKRSMLLTALAIGSLGVGVILQVLGQAGLLRI